MQKKLDNERRNREGTCLEIDKRGLKVELRQFPESLTLVGWEADGFAAIQIDEIGRVGQSPAMVLMRAAQIHTVHFRQQQKHDRDKYIDDHEKHLDLQ